MLRLSVTTFNIYAKPVIDMLVTVNDLSSVDALNPLFEALGYDCKGEFGIPGRRFYQKRKIKRTHHIHLFEQGNSEIKRHLAFRNYIADLAKPIIESNAFFSITFERNPRFKVGSSEESSVLGSDKSSVLTSVKILEEIKKNSKITANQLASMFGITQRAVEKQLASLKEQGRIERVGSKRAGHWEIK